MKRYRRRKCRHCKELFRPDPRNLRHQRYCSKPACRRASKAASQHRWLSKAQNRDYFRGAENVQRVRVVDDNSSSLDEKKRLTQRQEVFPVSSPVQQR